MKKYVIKQVIRGADGRSRRIKKEDLGIENNQRVREAFKIIYQLQNTKPKNY